MSLSRTTPPAHHAVASCSLGAVLVAVGERGIRAILLGEDPTALLRDLRERCPGAVPGPAGPELDDVLSRVVRMIEAPPDRMDLRLDPAGTAFQRRVWEAVGTVPVGATASYADIARRIGSPAAARAVARACAANPLAVAIPCHRVVRRDGRMGGYRWGLERKRALLGREARA
jgi:AraC family transcriptional regulator of adaptative response/methylated-DNA-[protein]-cysteine methyltransferase